MANAKFAGLRPVHIIIVTLFAVIVTSCSGGSGSPLPNQPDPPAPVEQTEEVNIVQRGGIDTNDPSQVIIIVPDKGVPAQGTTVRIPLGTSGVNSYKNDVRYKTSPTATTYTRTQMDYEVSPEGSPIMGGNMWFGDTRCNQVGTSTTTYEWKADKVGRFKVTYTSYYYPGVFASWWNEKFNKGDGEWVPDDDDDTGGRSGGKLRWKRPAIGATVITVLAMIFSCPDQSHIYWAEVYDPNAPPPVTQNLPPNAVVSASPKSGDKPLTVNFDASGSSDPDGTIVNYEWDFDGDGAYDFDSGADATVSYNYTIAGTYAAKVRVTDNDGAKDTASVSGGIVVTNPTTPPPANLVPVAVMNEIPSFGNAPLTVNFDGSGSYDTDGTIVKWEWFIDNVTAHVGVSFSHTFSVTGNYSVILEVTDDDGETDRVHWTMEVALGSLTLEFVDDNLTNTADPGNYRIVTFELKPLPTGVGFIHWELPSGPTDWFALPKPEGVHPQTRCEIWFNSVGTTRVRATAYASEKAFDDGEEALDSVEGTLTVN